MDNKWMTTKEAAHHTRLSAGTLENRRVKRLRPRYKKVGGKVLYNQAELDDWINSNGSEHILGRKRR